MAKTKRKNLHYLTLRANRKQVITIPLKVSVAKQSVQLNRTIADIQRGQEGLAITCANAECGLRLNGTAFPHPAYIIEFTDRRAYVVDKLNKAGTPVHCVVYEHGQGSFQKAYDTKGKNTLAKMSGAEVVILNAEPTQFDDLADVVVRGSISDVLPDILRSGG